MRRELGLTASAFAKWLAIARRRERFREFVEQLPPSFSTIYTIAVLSDPELDALVASGALTPHACREFLEKWISAHRFRASGVAPDPNLALEETRSRVNDGEAANEILNTAEELSRPHNPVDRHPGASEARVRGAVTDPYAAACTGRADDARKTAEPKSRAAKGQALREHCLVSIPRSMDAERVARLDQLLASCEQEFPGVLVVWLETQQRGAA